MTPRRRRTWILPIATAAAVLVVGAALASIDHGLTSPPGSASSPAAKLTVCRWKGNRSGAVGVSAVPGRSNGQNARGTREIAVSIDGRLGHPFPRAAERAAEAEASSRVIPCQALGPAAPYPICGVDCAAGRGCCQGWESMRLIQWQQFAQGEYCGQPRLPHVPEYRLRVDDEIDLVYRLTREQTAKPYRLEVADEIRVESFTDPELNRDLIIQPDGTITLRLLGQVHANGKTVAQLTEDLEQLYLKYYKVPAITVTPLKVNTRLEDLRESVDARYGQGGLQRIARVTPEGSIGLPVLGSVMVQGLTLPELRQELNERYNEQIPGIEVTPVLVRRAPRYVYVLGEVGQPGRFEMTGPTTLLQALSMAGSWNVGARIDQIVVFRRGDDWRLLATMVNLKEALYGNAPCPPGEIWLADSDVIIVPKSPILRATDFIDLVFTRGIYGVFPLNSTINFAKLSTL